MTSKDPSLTKKYLALAQEELVIVKGGRGMQSNCFMLSCLWVAEGLGCKQLVASSSVSLGNGESCADDVCLVTHIEGVCHKGLKDWEQAERCFLTVIDR